MRGAVPKKREPCTTITPITARRCEFAQEEIEEVAKISVPDERTGEPVARYLFLGDQYATRNEAEAARFGIVIEKAREFYKDLDRIYLARGRRPRTSMENPGEPDPSKHKI